MHTRPFLALVLLAAAPAAAAIDAGEIRTLSSVIVATTPQATVEAQWGALLRRHTPAGLSVSDAEHAAFAALAGLESETRRDLEALAARIERNNDLRSPLRTALADLRARQATLGRLLDVPADTRLAVADGDRLLAAARSASESAQRLQGLFDSLSDAGADLSLSDASADLSRELQQAMTRLSQHLAYLSNTTAKMHALILSVLSNLRG
jgi:hypothetical protein